MYFFDWESATLTEHDRSEAERLELERLIAEQNADDNCHDEKGNPLVRPEPETVSLFEPWGDDDEGSVLALNDLLGVAYDVAAMLDGECDEPIDESFFGPGCAPRPNNGNPIYRAIPLPSLRELLYESYVLSGERVPSPGRGRRSPGEKDGLAGWLYKQHVHFSVPREMLEIVTGRSSSNISHLIGYHAKKRGESLADLRDMEVRLPVYEDRNGRHWVSTRRLFDPYRSSRVDEIVREAFSRASSEVSSQSASETDATRGGSDDPPSRPSLRRAVPLRRARRVQMNDFVRSEISQ